MNPVPTLAIFASGSGSNAQRITEYFRHTGTARVAAVYCNTPGAGVLQRAENLGLPSVLFNRESFYSSQEVLSDLQKRGVDWIILAGFLWLVPDYLLRAFPQRVVNIHPALLPAYGGKGMYGMRVHEAVIASGDTRSGITIHYVNGKYDEGDIIFQADCRLSPADTPHSLAQKIHALEYEHFPRVIETLL
jgi:phosphoribosylglycinamide formyltransferase 1